MIIDRLIDRIIQTKSPICVGLDTKFDYIPRNELQESKGENALAYAAAEILRFNRVLIDEIADIVPAVKVQSAYYEMYGPAGVKAFADTLCYAKSAGLFTIADIKRNDIGSTAAAYSAAYLGRTRVGDREEAAFDADFVTINGYLGSDGVEPFVEDCKTYDKGAFVLAKTSNPSSGELQDKQADGRAVYEHMAGLITEWGATLVGKYGYSSIGAVVGATWPQQAADIRKKFPGLFMLIPGYGAQGGGAEDILANFDSNGLGGIVNNSRAILTAWKKPEYASLSFGKAAREATLAMQKDIQNTFQAHQVAFG